MRVFYKIASNLLTTIFSHSSLPITGAVATTVTQSITSPVTTSTITTGSSITSTGIKPEMDQQQQMPNQQQQPQLPNQQQQQQPQQQGQQQQQQQGQQGQLPQGQLQPQQVQLVKVGLLIHVCLVRGVAS